MKKALYIISAVCFAALFIILCLLDNRAHHIAVAPLPTWTPDETVASGLASGVVLQEYSIQPPLVCNRTDADALKMLDTFGVNMYQWHSRTGNREASGLSVQIIRRLNLDSPNDLLKHELYLESKDEENFVHTKPEMGNINGIVFSRAYWQGVEKVSSGSYARRGFLYCTTDTAKAICISGYDRTPCSDSLCSYQPSSWQTLPVIEAAAVSFRKR